MRSVARAGEGGARVTGEVRCLSCNQASPAVAHVGHCGLDDCRAFVEGYEAGRLAAVRAEVVRHVVACDQAIEALAESASLYPSDGDVARTAALVTSCCASEAADCRRWLEATS